MELLYVLLVLLVVTRTFGELAERFGQPALVGELVSGVVLGLAVSRFSGTFPVLAGLGDDAVFHAVTDLGIFFVMLQAGLELRPKDLARSSRKALSVAAGGMLLPLALGLGAGWWLLPAGPAKAPQALFLGVALAVTAVPVAVRVLMDVGMLDSDLGRTVVSAALADDVLSLVLLAVLTAVLRTGAMPDAAGLGLLALHVAGFFAAVLAVGGWLMPWLGRRLSKLSGAEVEFSFLLVSALALSVLAELLGMHFILGAFGAGLFFGRHTIDPRTFDAVTNRVSAVSAGFLAPLFFASIGLHLDASSLLATPGFVLLILALATVGKLVGCGLPAAAAGLGRREALAVGVAMNARGAVELVIADIALRAGLFEPVDGEPLVANLFSTVVIVAVVTTLATPIALRPLVGRA